MLIFPNKEVLYTVSHLARLSGCSRNSGSADKKKLPRLEEASRFEGVAVLFYYILFYWGIHYLIFSN
ncbi:hypothetical protein B14911_06923 [Bacillus sp. NRRL B-14911]|nr:hypothetical protein B14911_06923 [Bacillus sp. NRRL B-14911]